jgi:hypothetical protein
LSHGQRQRGSCGSFLRRVAEEASDFGRAAFGRKVKGGFVVVPFATRVRAPRQQQFHHASGEGVRTGGQHQGRVAANIALVYLGAVIEQQAHDLLVACGAGVAESCLVAFGDGASVGAAIQQQLHCRGTAVGSGHHQGRFARAILGVDHGLCVE